MIILMITTFFLIPSSIAMADEAIPFCSSNGDVSSYMEGKYANSKMTMIYGLVGISPWDNNASSIAVISGYMK